MLTIYRTDASGHVDEIADFEKGSWIQLVNPTKDEADQVIAASGIPEDFVYDPLDIEEKPRFEKDDEGLLMIIDVPYVEEDDTGRAYNTIPLGIIVTGRHFITVCSRELDVLNLFSTGKARLFRTNYRSRFVFQILHRVSMTYLRFLRQIDRRMDELEQELQRSMRNQEIFQLAFINDVRLIDLEWAWSESVCNNDVCELYNMPDGLHPSALGNQLIAEKIYESFYGKTPATTEEK